MNDRSKTARKELSWVGGVGEELVHYSFFGSFALAWFGFGGWKWKRGNRLESWSGPKSGKDANLSQSRAQQGGRFARGAAANGLITYSISPLTIPRVQASKQASKHGKKTDKLFVVLKYSENRPPPGKGQGQGQGTGTSSSLNVPELRYLPPLQPSDFI